MRSFFSSFRFKLIFFTFLIEVIMLSLLVINSTRVIESYLAKQAQVNLADLKESFNSSLAGLLASRDYASVKSLLDSWVGNKNIIYMLISKDGKIIISSGEKKDRLPAISSNGFSDEKPVFDTSMEIAFGGQKFGVLHFGVSTEFLKQAKNELISQSFLIALLEILLSGVLLFGIGIYLTRNLVRLTEASKLVAKGSYDLELSVDGNDELSVLAGSFVEMADEIKQKIAQLNDMNEHLKELVEIEVQKVRDRDEVIHEQTRQKALSELLVNIAHQWRQPLNVIALQASHIDDIFEYEDGDRAEIEKSTKKIVEQTKELSSVITSFTKFYEKPALELFEIRSAISHSCALFKAHFERLNINITINGCETSARGDEKVFVEIVNTLFQNIMDIIVIRNLNSANIDIKCQSGDKYVELTIEDDCGGIDKEILPKVFDPYSTMQFKSRNKGLGLYMASSLAKHILHAEIEAENGNSGAIFKIRISK